jgi:hypothetical protein
MGQNPLSYYILYTESKHNILALVSKANKTQQKESVIRINEFMGRSQISFYFIFLVKEPR